MWLQKRASRPFDKWVVLAGNVSAHHTLISGMLLRERDCSYLQGSRPYRGRSTDGPALEQALNEPHGMAVTSDGSGDVYIAEVKLFRARTSPART